MDYVDYEKLSEHRTVLLDLYKSLEQAFAREGNKKIDIDLKKQQENIEAEKFLLAIVGEVKAGKSTFINALLGEAVLPFDVLQATSEIIEIYKSDKKEIRVTFANGKERVVEDDLQTPENEIVPILQEYASVQEEYRAIPIVQVNKFLIEHYDEKAGKAVFKKEELDAFIEDDDPPLENVNNLDKAEFGDKIREYIKKNIAGDTIPKEIVLGYPLDFEAKHFRLVDTPGINAIGGIEKQTEEFIHQADAVIYLHRAGQQESKELRNALENELPERVKKHLMLILTHRSYYFSSGECDRMLEITNNYYNRRGICSKNIFFVDSLTELHLPKFYEAETMDSVNAIFSKDQALMGLVAPCAMQANGNLYTFIDLLEEQSNFKEIRNRIEEDAKKSASIQMKDFASDLKEKYEVLDNKVGDRIKSLKKKYKNPQSFAGEAKRQIDEMENLKDDYNKFSSYLIREFDTQNTNSIYYKEIEKKIMKSFEDKINNKKFGSEDSKNALSSYVNKLAQDFDDEMKRFVNKLQEDFRTIIQERNIELQGKYSITVPKIAISSIFSSALKKTEKEIKNKLSQVEKSKGGLGYWLGNIIFLGEPYRKKERQKDNIRKSLIPKTWEEMKGEIIGRLLNNKTKVQDDVDSLIEEFLKKYTDEFNGELSSRQQYLDDLKKNKKANEELKGEISQLEEKKRMFSDSIKKCIAIKGELR